MQIQKNNQLNFKSLSFTPNALNALSKRLPSGQFMQVQEKYIKKYEKSPFEIVIDTQTGGSQRLIAKIKELKNIKGVLKIWSIVDIFKENSFSSMFRSPEKFLEKLDKKHFF